MKDIITTYYRLIHYNIIFLVILLHKPCVAAVRIEVDMGALVRAREFKIYYPKAHYKDNMPLCLELNMGNRWQEFNSEPVKFNLFKLQLTAYRPAQKRVRAEI